MSSMSAYKVRINTNTADSSAIILLADGVLIGVLCELFDECHGADRGKWAIETTFGLNETAMPAMFGSASDAANWLTARIVGARFNLAEPVPELH